jgi:anti-anti-sigma factor
MTEARLLVQNIGGVAVVDLSDAAILDGPTIQAIAQRLYALVDEQAQRKIVLVFSQVKFLSSTMLGVLIAMRKKADGIKGRVAICGLRPELRKVFRITRTEKLFEFYDAEEPALNSYGVYTSP